MIHNGSKRIISVSSEFGLLQMVSELDTERCVSVGIVRSHISLESRTKHSLYVRVWKPLPMRLLAIRKRIVFASGLGCYKWHQSQTPSGVPAKTLAPKGDGL